MEADMEPVPADVEVETPLIFHDSWNERQQQVLIVNLGYYRKMLDTTHNLITHGNRSQQLPAKPQTSLKQLIIPNRGKAPMTPNELHELLVKEIIEQPRPSWTPYIGRSWQNTEQTLIEGMEFIRSEEKKMFGYYIAYGKVLNNAFLLYKTNMRTINLPWKQWLVQTIGIKEAYARKLRALQKELEIYPKFKRLGLSYSMVYKHFSLIKVMLLDAEIANFWRQP